MTACEELPCHLRWPEFGSTLPRKRFRSDTFAFLGMEKLLFFCYYHHVPDKKIDAGMRFEAENL